MLKPAPSVECPKSLRRESSFPLQRAFVTVRTVNRLSLHEMHSELGGGFVSTNGTEVVADYGDTAAEQAALRGAVGVLDLSCRGRVCLTGADRLKFLHGQVTNDVQRLRVGEGCYAALVNAKGRMQGDLNIYRLPDELLLDFEPGYTPAIADRLEKFIVTEEVHILDAAPHYGLLSIQGPRAVETITQLSLSWPLPAAALSFSGVLDTTLGQLYLMNHARTGSMGYDLFAPTPALGAIFDKLVAAAKSLGGRACGWHALETARILAGIPRFGQDMDETTLPPEAGIESRAISYSKGCYIGQEVIARIRTYGQVARTLRTLHLPPAAAAPGDKLLADGKEVGHLTSVIPGRALGYVRKEHHAPGTRLTLRTAAGEAIATVGELVSHGQAPEASS